MLERLEDIAGPNFAAAVLWTFAALLLLVIVLVIVRLIRSLTFGTFVAGGRNRKTRLAVMDAAAVDSHRRLVLVRRDDVEHLILIGGPTDVVVERDIKLGQLRRPAMTGDTRNETSAPQRPKPQEPLPVRAAPAQPAPAQPARAQPAPPAQQQLAARPVRDIASPPAAPRPEPARLQPAAAGPSPATLQTNSISTTIRQNPLPHLGTQHSLDDTLLKELEVTFDAGPPSKVTMPQEQSLDDEMTKLLGELANHKR